MPVIVVVGQKKLPSAVGIGEAVGNGPPAPEPPWFVLLNSEVVDFASCQSLVVASFKLASCLSDSVDEASESIRPGVGGDVC